MKKIKELWESLCDFCQEAYTGATLFVESLSLIVVSAFAFYGVNTYDFRAEYKYVVFGAAVIIALRGAYEFLRHIRKIGAK